MKTTADFKDFGNSSGKPRSNNPVFSLKVSETEKTQNDNQWYKDYMSYILPATSLIVNDYEMMKTSYEVNNNNIDGFKKKIKEFCQPLGEDIGQIEEEVVPYPEIFNKVSVLKGEMLKRGDNFKIILLTTKAIKEKNEALFNAIKESVDEKLAIILEKQKMQMQGMSEEEVQKQIEQLRTQLEPEDLLAKDWQSDTEIFYSKGLAYCYYDQDIKTKKLETFEDVIVADRCFIYSGWKHGKPYLQIRNPLFCGFHKSPNERYVHKGDYFWYRQSITPATALNEYELTTDELNRLGLTTYTAGANDVRHSLGSKAKPVYDQTNMELALASDPTIGGANYNKAIGTHQANSGVNRRQSDLIWETHFEFKAFKEIIFLSYTDEYNEEVVTVMPNNFSDFIPKDARVEQFTNRYGVKTSRQVWIDPVSQTEYSAEKLWIPRRYELIRLGNDVYPICREVPNQHTNIEDPFGSFELSTKGAVFTARNAKSVALLQRALPAYFQLIYIKHIQNRELAKYLGSTLDMDIDQIPEDLGKDMNGEPIRDKFMTWFAYLKKTGINFYSGSQTALGGLPPATRSPGSRGTSFDNAMNLFNLQQLIEMVKREIGIAMGISPQREANFQSGSNVSDNQQSIQQSYHITEPYFYLHNEVWKHALNDWLINFRTYCNSIFLANPNLKEHSFHYILPNGVEELLRVTPNSLTHAQIGLFLNNSGNEQRYMDIMLQNSLTFAQNGGEGMTAISSMVNAIVGGASPQEIHKMIVMQEQEQQKRQQQMEQAKLASQEKQTQMQVELREDVQAHEIEKIRVKAEEDRQTAIATATISALGFSEDKDMNDNGVPDIVDIAKLALDEKKLELDKQKFDHQKGVDKEKLVIDKIKARKPTTSKK